MAESRPPNHKKQALSDIESKGHRLSRMATHAIEDQVAIERQLGFLPTNVQSVAARADSGATRSLPPIGNLARLRIVCHKCTAICTSDAACIFFYSSLVLV